jgi:chromosome segregation ATPase
MQEKLDGLLQGYVRLLDAGQSQREHVRQTNPDEIEREIEQLQKTISRESSKVQDINRKRIEILKKRVEKFEKIRENLEVIDAQCSAIEDVLHLIRDQSVTMRDPQQVSDQLESLMVDVEHTEQTVREVEAIFSITAADGSEHIDLPQRGKVRN